MYTSRRVSLSVFRRFTAHSGDAAIGYARGKKRRRGRGRRRSSRADAVV